MATIDRPLSSTICIFQATKLFIRMNERERQPEKERAREIERERETEEKKRKIEKRKFLSCFECRWMSFQKLRYSNTIGHGVPPYFICSVCVFLFSLNGLNCNKKMIVQTAYLYRFHLYSLLRIHFHSFEFLIPFPFPVQLLFINWKISECDHFQSNFISVNSLNSIDKSFTVFGLVWYAMDSHNYRIKCVQSQ